MVNGLKVEMITWTEILRQTENDTRDNHLTSIGHTVANLLQQLS